METPKGIALTQLVEEMGMEIWHRSGDFDSIRITTEDVNRCGLQLTGFYGYFDPRRIQIMGLVETTYLAGLPAEDRRESFQALMSKRIPALVICRGIRPFPECVEVAKRCDKPLLLTQDTTTVFMSRLITRLHVLLAPTVTRHGVLVEIYGEGVLMFGESGVGKSETAIELVKRGHRLIADDAVEIRRLDDRTLLGSAPDLIRHYIELRGIGVIDVRQLFGMSAVKLSQEIDVVINLEPWKEGFMYDRLGLEELHTTILGVEVPSLTVPVKPGRNLAVIIEVAAMNNRQKKMGYNAAQEFTNQLNAHFAAEAAGEAGAADAEKMP